MYVYIHISFGCSTHCKLLKWTKVSRRETRHKFVVLSICLCWLGLGKFCFLFFSIQTISIVALSDLILGFSCLESCYITLPCKTQLCICIAHYAVKLICLYFIPFLYRFEMPFNIWCGGCNSMIAKGVRFNAEKKQVGNYYSTKVPCISHVDISRKLRMILVTCDGISFNCYFVKYYRFEQKL